MSSLGRTVTRLAQGSAGRTEADIQADVRNVLLEAPLELTDCDLLDVSLESPAGGKRIDVEAGCAVIEVKKNLRSKRTLEAAVAQLRGYVDHRTEERSQRYVGVLTDGQDWILYHLQPNGEMAEVDRLRLKGGDGERLSAWLEAILATTDKITPVPAEIVRLLGSDSPAARLDLADLRALYEACRRSPEVQLKRELWARLLLSALGTSFEDSDELFVTHTYLVLCAELIAHEVMGLPTDAATTDVRALLEGQQFAVAGLHGVVEADFFDWPATHSLGRPIIAGIARRLSRFEWSNVRHDVLKALYESVIDVDTRRRLGEYYTPDWLAQKIVTEQFDEPLNQRVLDPSCGSGTFLFWAVRRLLEACDAAGMSNREAVSRVITQVHGMDLHPVAVTLARVTYLLALTPKRLEDRDDLTVPVFLGDSVRWEQDDTVLTEHGMTVRTSDPLELVDDELHFPEGVVEEPQRFDRLVADLAERAAAREPGDRVPGIVGLLNRHRVDEDDREAIKLTFKKLCRLHDDGRDHVWSYYIRNLIRPLSFTRPGGHADILVGNPPWLAYRSMPEKLQKAYRNLSIERGLWAGGKVATHQDLSDLFVARSVEQYLNVGAKFAFVMPFATLSRRQFAGFRSGAWDKGGEGARANFNLAEDMALVKPPLFAVPCCVISGTKARKATPLPPQTVAWTGRVPSHQPDWPSVAEHLTSAPGSISSVGGGADESPYRQSFRQGATLVPRVLVTVEEAPDSPIGVSAGRVRVRSARSANEKKPWKHLDSLEGVVEAQFLRPMHLGATMVSYRSRAPQLAVVPWDGEAFLDGSAEALDEYPGLAAWWRCAERAWEENKTDASRLSLLERLDYQRLLASQFPIAAERVVYTKSGQHLAACRISDPEAVIDHKLYWAEVESVDEGRYLCAILNSGILAEQVVKLQARGQHNPRDFDSHVFTAVFPLFDSRRDDHLELAGLGKQAETLTAAVDLDDAWQFQKARRVVRDALKEDGLAGRIDMAVSELLGLTAKGPAHPPTPSTDFLGALGEAQKSAKSRPRKTKRKSAKSKAKATGKPTASKEIQRTRKRR